MITNNLCTPALLYIGFTIIHIVIDLFNKLYNSALIKFTLMIVFSIILNLLCKSGLGVLSWIIVFIPFILLSTITLWLLVSLGWAIDSGFLYYKIKDDTEVSNQENGVEIVGETIDTTKTNTLSPETIDSQATQSDVNIEDTSTENGDGSTSTENGGGSTSTENGGGSTDTIGDAVTDYDGCQVKTTKSTCNSESLCVWCPTENNCLPLVGSGAGCATNPDQSSTIDIQDSEAIAAGLINTDTGGGTNADVNGDTNTHKMEKHDPDSNGDNVYITTHD